MTIIYQCPKCKARMTIAVLRRKDFRCAQCGYKKKRAWATYKEEPKNEDKKDKPKKEDLLKKLAYESARDFDELCVLYMAGQIEV